MCVFQRVPMAPKKDSTKNRTPKKPIFPSTHPLRNMDTNESSGLGEKYPLDRVV